MHHFFIRHYCFCLFFVKLFLRIAACSRVDGGAERPQLTEQHGEFSPANPVSRYDVKIK